MMCACVWNSDFYGFTGPGTHNTNANTRLFGCLNKYIHIIVCVSQEESRNEIIHDVMAFVRQTIIFFETTIKLWHTFFGVNNDIGSLLLIVNSISLDIGDLCDLHR